VTSSSFYKNVDYKNVEYYHMTVPEGKKVGYVRASLVSPSKLSPSIILFDNDGHQQPAQR
jgi:hypothetical protein